MANFENGVKEYIMASSKVTVGFPVDFRGNPSINCYMCKFFSRSSGICYLTKEVSEYPEKYVGSKCPLELCEKEE